MSDTQKTINSENAILLQHLLDTIPNENKISIERSFTAKFLEVVSGGKSATAAVTYCLEVYIEVVKNLKESLEPEKS